MDSSGAIETVIHETAHGPFRVVRRELTNDHLFDVFEVRYPGGNYSLVCHTAEDAMRQAEAASSMWGLLKDALRTWEASPPRRRWPWQRRSR